MWRALSLILPPEALPSAEAALFEAGALALDTADADLGLVGERPIFAEPGEPADQVWPRNRISALFSAATTTDLGLAALGVALQNAAGVSGSLPQVVAVDEQDWVRATQNQFAALPIAPGFWIVPTWCTPPEPGALNLRLDPGLAFGTGSHPTTRLCLQWLHGRALAGQRVLDYGCGSGILAIAAVKLGAAGGIGLDIDPHALPAAAANATLNDVANLRWLDADERVSERFPIVVANILANPLIVLAPALCGHALPNAAIALSGILETQAEEVIDAYAPWAKLQVEATDEGWVLLAGRCF